MSDDEAEEEEEQFAYSDDDADAPEAAEDAVTAENSYYKAKEAAAAGSFEEACSGMESVLALEAGGTSEDLSEWGFKASKQLIKFAFRSGQVALMLENYK